jgi:SAM-dependent methyltransferase
VTADRQETQAYLEKFDQLLRAAVEYKRGKALSAQIGGSDGGRPVNISRDPEAFREFEYLGWKTAVERYHSAWGDLTQQAVSPLLDMLNIEAGADLLDVATGPGYVAAAAHERGAHAIGVDFSPAMVTKARDLYPDVAFREGDAERLPFEDSTFDAVAMNFGMLHLGRPEVAMKEAFRVLKHGGRFAFTVWAKPDEAVGFKVVLRAVEEYGEHVTVPHGPDFFYYSRPEECRVALTTVGFAAPSVMLLDLAWRLSSSNDVFAAFFEGTARTGALLRRQPPEARRSIEKEVQRSAGRFETMAGSVEIPMPAILAWATRH